MRVQKARNLKDETLKALFLEKNVVYPPLGLHIRAFKREKILEIWALQAEGQPYRLMKSYPFCASSGSPGPKRRQGDLQIPEGVYIVDRYNPWSSFFLSLGINYPNRSDRLRGDQADPGDDIFIHGACVTIGCIPITDDGIMEVFWLAYQARSSNPVTVHIFPGRMDNRSLARLRAMVLRREIWRNYHLRIGSSHPRTRGDLFAFWNELKSIHDYFSEHRRLPVIDISADGTYRIRGEPNGRPSG